MKMKTTIAFLSMLILIAQAHSAEPKKHIMVLGGGGEEPTKINTIFDASLSNLGNYVAPNRWGESTISFNGGHSETESIIQTKFKKRNEPFTNQSFNSLIEGYKTKISNGTIGSGDQLMVYIDSHGAIRLNGETSHQIATSGESITNYNTLGSTTVNLDKLKELTEIAEKKGVKLAILDFSCHSGNSIRLASANTCVVTSTGPNHYGYGGNGGTFSYNFTNLMAKGKNLEEIFLEARKTTTDKSFPMISTPENNAIAEFEYLNISPYLYYHEKDTDKLTPYLLDVSSKDLACKREQSFSKLQELISYVEKINTTKKKVLFTKVEEKEVDLSELRSSLNEYKDLQDKILKNLKALNMGLLNNETEIASSDNKYDLRIVDKKKWSEIIATDYDAEINRIRQRVAQKNDQDPQSTDNLLIKYYQNGKRKKDQIIRENPDLSKIKRVMSELDQSSLRTQELAQKISTGEKKLYNALYLGQKGIYQDQLNPCKGFVL